MAAYIKPVALDTDTFASFGTVLETDQKHSYSINEGTTNRYHRLAISEALPAPLASEATRGLPAQTILSIFEGKPYPIPVRLWMFERHPLGSQAFMPIDGNPWLVVVSDAVMPSDASRIWAFIARGDQGVSYFPGIWHHPLIALKRPSRFLVVDRDGPGINLDEVRLRERVIITSDLLEE